jgi:hypothetical protein
MFSRIKIIRSPVGSATKNGDDDVSAITTTVAVTPGRNPPKDRTGGETPNSSTKGKNMGSNKPDTARQLFLRDSEGGPVEDDYYTKSSFAVKALFHFLAEHPDEFPLPEEGVNVAEPFAGAGNLAREIEKQKSVNKVFQSDLFSIEGEHTDFFKADLHEGTDIIITNSSWGPTGAKEKTIERCIELGKPACLLFPYTVVGQVKAMKILRRVVRFS